MVRICKGLAAEPFSFPCASFQDVYAGKICAALERQHPRDLFDIKLLLENEGITEKLKDAFLFYLISSKRPYHEILNSRTKNIDNTFKKSFEGMVDGNITVSHLSQALIDLRLSLKKMMSRQDLDLLVSTLEMKPRWELSKISDLGSYPSVKWRLFNIGKMRSDKRQREIHLLSKWFND
ncbi:MAG: nucleotidyl transferase AbiEii/AbiGii toxin family protein [Deltaproteobacteria bacterium]|nr:nucleotidyl transferase AbiEii/AbiGii toxin family protein [Deltaproteobacteria bacterium]